MKRKVMNRKTLLLSTALILVVAIIGVSSFANAGINPDYWRSSKFISDLILLIALVLIGVATGNAEGDNLTRNNPNGLFVATYNNYNDKRSMISKIIDKFKDWNFHLYKQEYYDKVLRFLEQDYGIKQAELILQLDRTQIVQLENSPKMFQVDGKERYFNSLTEMQIKAILWVLDGKLKVKFIHESYFLNAYAKNMTKSMYEQAGQQEQEKRKKFTILMTYRVITTIISSMILTALVVDTANGKATSQAVLDLLSRYFTLFSSCVWGYVIAQDMIKDECLFLDYKATILERFYLEVEVNKTFIAKTEEEKAFDKITEMLQEGEIANGKRIN